MDRITTYTSVDNLKKFFLSIDQNSLSNLLQQDPDSIDNIKSLYDLIFKKSNLLYDDEVEFETQVLAQNPWFMALINAQNGGSRLIPFSNFHYLVTDEDSAINTEPNSIHIYNGGLTNSVFGHYISDCNDVLPISSSITYRLDRRNQEKSNFPGWNQVFDKLALPINSAVICDNFLLKNNQSWRNNLFKIIESLLPHSLSTDFHLTLITKQQGTINTAENTIQPLYDSIQEFITDLECDFEIKFSLIATAGNDFHDRHIFTNYCRTTSGASFDQFYNSQMQINVNTYVEVKPLNSEKGGTSYFREINPFKVIFDNAIENEIYGDLENRLLI